MNLDELNKLFASAWTSEDKALMFEGIVRGSNGSEAPEGAPQKMRDANALGLKWRKEAEDFLAQSSAFGKKSAEARKARFGTSQPPSENSRTPFEDYSNQATSYKLQAVKEQQVSLASLEETPANMQQPESADVASTGTILSQTLALPPDQPLSSRATPHPPHCAAPPSPCRGPHELEAAELYAIYPRKEARGAAIKAIARAIKKDGYRPLLDATIAYAEAVKKWPADEREFIPHAATWFNQERYFDDRSTWVRASKPLSGRQPSAPQVFAKL